MQIGGTAVDLPSVVPTGGLGALQTIMGNVMVIFLFVGICFTLIYIIWGAMQWIRASGDKQKLTAARSKITVAITGFILLLLSYAIVNIVGFLFQVDLLKLV